MHVTVDGIKEVVPSITAMIVVIGALLMAFVLIRDGSISGEVGVALIASAATQGINYIFQSSQNRTISNTIERTATAVTNGAATAAVKAAAAQETQNA